MISFTILITKGKEPYGPFIPPQLKLKIKGFLTSSDKNTDFIHVIVFLANKQQNNAGRFLIFSQTFTANLEA